MKPKERLIVALDTEDLKTAVKLVKVLSPEVEIFKVGIAPFTGFGGKLLKEIHSRGKKVFLDLKFHDIPNTVKNAVKIAAQKGVFMINVHCIGGSAMLEAAVEGKKEAKLKKGGTSPILLGVTVLTSMNDSDLKDIGIKETVEQKVDMFVKNAKKAGLDGVVASAKEIERIRKAAGKKFIIVTPGIRPAFSPADDQKRVMTPYEAVKEGADYIVVGRPIIHAKDPLVAVRKVLDEIRYT